MSRYIVTITRTTCYDIVDATCAEEAVSTALGNREAPSDAKINSEWEDAVKHDFEEVNE